MTTVAQWIERTGRDLHGSEREERNKLAAAVDADDTTWTFTYSTNGIQQGAYLAVGLELVYVWSVNASAQTAVVERGQFGSTAAAQDEGAVVTVNPKFPAFSILEELNAELLDLSSPSNGLFQVETLDITYTSGVYGYDLAAGVLAVLEVRADTSGPGNDWPTVRDWSLVRDMPAADFASGVGIVLRDPVEHGRTVRVRYAAPFTTLSSLAQNVESVSGLPATAVDIPPLGAAARLMAFREPSRSFTDAQPDPRRAREVPVGGASRSAGVLLELRRSRIHAEAVRLRQQYPRMKAG